MNKSNKSKIEEIISRGVNEVINKDNLLNKLNSGKKLRVKFGIDPTAPNIHIGRAVLLLKLKDFQDLGHNIIFIVGDTTGVIGDTSDKESERPMLSKKDIKKNMKNYVKQIGKILDIKKIEVYYNSEWLEGLGYGEIGDQADQFSLSDFIARENIKKRITQGKRVSLREVLYPIMQGYDSVKVASDIEIGGTDQRFNLLAGRKLQEYFNQKPQDILMMNLIMGLDGRKMSTSWGNTVDIMDSPNDMYGKIMSLNDKEIIQYFISCTRIPLEEVENLEKKMNEGSLNPRDVKMSLSYEITKIFHTEREAKKAQENFIKTFQKKEIPKKMDVVITKKGNLLSDIAVNFGLVKSKSDFRRLIKSGAVSNLKKGEKISDEHFKIIKPVAIKIGKKRFISIKLN